MMEKNEKAKSILYPEFISFTRDVTRSKRQRVGEILKRNQFARRTHSRRKVQL